MPAINYAPENAEPWERQRGESEQAWEAFQIYRDQKRGHRSQREVAATLGKTEALISRWSSLHGWVSRAAAYDNEADRLDREAKEEERRGMLARHTQLARMMQQKAIEAIRSIDVARLANHPDSVAKWVELSAKLERGALGDPTEEDLAAATYRALWERLQPHMGD